MIEISNFSLDNPRFVKMMGRQREIPKEVMQTVSDILEDVRVHGDEALNKYMKKFDQIDLDQVDLRVSQAEMEDAKKNVSPKFAAALQRACDNLIEFHKGQVPQGYTKKFGHNVVLERKYVPIQKVAVTVPGDMAPLASSLYMNLVPAIVAGVPEIYILSKPKNGKINDYLLYVADYLKVKNILKISGAQGIAALAYGTKKIPKVDAIVGPGNNWTQMAKKLLYGVVKIDSMAGPSEIVIIADEQANPKFIAADLLSQAEHGTGYEASVAFCRSQTQAEAIKSHLEKLVAEHNLTSVQNSLRDFGNIFVVDSLQTAIAATNQIAPEHVEILAHNSEEIINQITNAGAVFVGEYSPEPVGDYFCGTNHILPTNGTARFSSGLSVLDFIRGFSVIRYTQDALVENADYIRSLAEPEGMKAHQLSVTVRLPE